MSVMKREKRDDCYLCGKPLPAKPWYTFVEVDGKPLARPMCEGCSKPMQDSVNKKAK